MVHKGLHFNRTRFILLKKQNKRNGLKANADLYQGVDKTWYLQRCCCVINENGMLGEK